MAEICGCTERKRSEEDQCRYVAAGRFKAYIKSKMGSEGSVECTWKPDFRISLKKVYAEVLIASISVAGTVVADDAVCRTAFGVDAQAILAEYKKFKQ